jgi:AcrR family transcriptional regulator
VNKALRATSNLPSTPAETDGRRRRSQDSRERIVAAMLELIHSGEISPGAEQVAVRAQVGLRTVFRHFNDMDSLYREMSKAIEAELRQIIDKPLDGADWRERLTNLIHRRALAFEKVGPYKRASDVHRHTSPVLQADHIRMVAILREILKAAVSPEIARDPIRFEALEVLMSFEAWNRMRRDQGLTAKRAAAVIEAAAFRLMD